MLKKYLFLILFIFTLFWFNYSYASINLTVSPIKYEITANTWTIITKTAKIINNSDNGFHIYTWKSDFTTTDNTWNPKFVRKSELVNPDQQLSEWVTISTWSFFLWAHTEKEINFTIDIPSDATPWWHYWAVFFKNPNSEQASWNSLSINVDYWVLILLNVEWEVISDWDIDEPVIYWWRSSHKPEEPKQDDCIFWDFTASRYDWKCIDNFLNKDENKNTENNISTWSVDDNLKNKDEDFSIKIDIPFNNKWNTHLKPEGKIIIIDDEWRESKWIWKKVITDDRWVVIWEEVVDYLPINDIWWNVLPFSERTFEAEWKWFPYKKYDKEWNIIIDYWSPWEYYSIQNTKNKSVLMFWEREMQRKVTKKLKFFVDLGYKDNLWEDIPLNSAKEFEITYFETYVWYNYYVLSVIWFLIFIILLWFLILIFKKKYRCQSCNKKIKKDMKICPYCWEKQDRENSKKHHKKDKKWKIK